MKIALIANSCSGGVNKEKLMPDGEIFGTTPTEITVLPRLVKYFV